MTAVSTEQTIRTVVQEVLAQLAKSGKAGSHNGHSHAGDWGVFDCVDGAVAAATEAFEKLKSASMEDRGKAIQIVKDICFDQAVELGTAELRSGGLITRSKSCRSFVEFRALSTSSRTRSPVTTV